jgi:hypothetical protein
MLQFSGDLAQVKFYQNNHGQIFVKLNDGSMIDGALCFSFLLFSFQSISLLVKIYFLLSSSVRNNRHQTTSSSFIKNEQGYSNSRNS